jgi:hypothetical protein
MKPSEIVSKLHGVFIFYLLFGGIFISQREFLVFLIPTLQYQYLINNNKCLLTQIQEKLMNDETKKEDTSEIKIQSFITNQMEKYNIKIKPEISEKALHTILYCLFMGNYFML